ncbi:unnamed protein product [Ectocarpus sp. 13 AM-2016]
MIRRYPRQDVASRGRLVDCTRDTVLNHLCVWYEPDQVVGYGIRVLLITDSGRGGHRLKAYIFTLPRSNIENLVARNSIFQHQMTPERRWHCIARICGSATGSGK